MASVRMTLALKERLSENYKRQCQTAYNSSLDVDSTVKNIVETIQDADAMDFAMLVETAEHMQRLLDKHADKYKHLGDSANRYGVANGCISNCTDSGYNRGAQQLNNLPIVMAKELHLSLIHI